MVSKAFGLSQLGDTDSIRVDGANNILQVTGNVVVGNATSNVSITNEGVNKDGSLISTPTGTVMHFASNTAPSGFIKCNGATISRSTYAKLFAVIGITYGAGDGSTTFVIPDLRGEFIRGWDDGRAIDSGRVFGTGQGDEFKSHTHTQRVANSVGATQGTAYKGTVSSPEFNSFETLATGGTETRPRNIALLACIKF